MIQTVWSDDLVYQFNVCLYKLHIVFKYYRIFSLQRFRMALHVVAALIRVYTIFSMLQTLLQRVLFAANWKFRFAPHPGDRCILSERHLLSLAVKNVILDWTLLFLPMPISWTLQMSLVHKFEISIVVIVGGLSVSNFPTGKTSATVCCL